MASRLTIRAASREDKEVIMAINDNAIDGRDYLEDYFEYFIESLYSFPIVGELNEKIVVFLNITLVDGGQTIVGRAGRLRPECHGHGVYRQFIELIKNEFRRSSDVTNLAYGVTSELAAPGKLFNKASHFYVFDVSKDFKDRLETILGKSQSTGALKVLDESDILELLGNQQMTSYLFPNKRAIVDRVPFRLQTENATLLFGRNTVFLSDVRSESDNTSGLLTAFILHKSISTPSMAIIDVFGDGLGSLKKHLATHFSRVGPDVQTPVSVEIVTDANVSHESLNMEIADFRLVHINYAERYERVFESKL